MAEPSWPRDKMPLMPDQKPTLDCEMAKSRKRSRRGMGLVSRRLIVWIVLFVLGASTVVTGLGILFLDLAVKIGGYTFGMQSGWFYCDDPSGPRQLPCWIAFLLQAGLFALMLYWVRSKNRRLLYIFLDLLGLGLMMVSMVLLWGWREWRQSNRANSEGIARMLAIYAVISGGFALGTWVARAALKRHSSKIRMQRSARGLCPTCGYDLTGNVSGLCPECGSPNSYGIPRTSR